MSSITPNLTTTKLPGEFGFSVLSLNVFAVLSAKSTAKKSRGKKGMSASFLVRTHYKPCCDEFKQKCMRDSLKRINRYKVIALTQEVILKHQPLVYTDSQYATENRNLSLNVQLALECGFHMLTQMNAQYFPQNRFPSGCRKFDRESFIEAILDSLAKRHLWCEHFFFLAAEHYGDFPVIPIAHFWYAVDQWGLTYAEAASVIPATAGI